MIDTWEHISVVIRVLGNVVVRGIDWDPLQLGLAPPSYDVVIVVGVV